MKVLTFSRVYPKYHPKAGQPTWFVEKIWKALWELTSFQGMADYEAAYQHAFPVGNLEEENIHFHSPKYHTIRAGHRWKPGDYFSPRVWSSKAYRSPQVQFAPPMKVEKVLDIEIRANDHFCIDHCDFGTFCEVNPDIEKLAKNDGLDIMDLLNWFTNTKDFDGQIICWNEKIEY